MTVFLVIAALMIGAAVLVLVRPLLRVPAGARPALISAVVLGILVPVTTAALYHRFSNFSWEGGGAELAAGTPPSVPQMLAKLERHLVEHPDDVGGWTMLGRSNYVLKNYPASVAAYERAYALTAGKDAEVDASLAEALAMTDRQSLTTRGASLLDEALRADPKNPRALWYGGVVAYNQGNRELARSRWLAVLDLGPPVEVARTLAEQINKIDHDLGHAPDPRLVAMAQAGAEPAAAPDDGAAAGEGDAGEGPAQAGPVVRLKVSLSPALRAKLDGSATLFVFAQDPDTPGPPLAVKRFAPGQTLPVEVDLSAADAMMPSRTLARVSQAKIVARYSKSGQPLAAHGDLYGELTYDVKRSDRAALVIDQVVP